MLFVHSSNEMYGADRMLLEVIGTLSQSDLARVLVWLPSDISNGVNPLSAELERRGVRFEIRSFPILRRQYLRLSHLAQFTRDVISTAKEIKRIKPQLLFCATSAVLPIAWITRLSIRSRILLHCQEIWGGPEKYILRLLSYPVNSIICISEATRQPLSRRGRRRALVIPNAVSEAPQPRIEPRLSTEPLVFLMASRWNRWKGHGTLLAAWDTSIPIGRLVILGGLPPVGAGVDVPRLIEGLVHPETVECIGEVSDITSFIDASDFILLPSDSPEPFGLVAIEAFSRGRAVIGSKGGGLAQIVENGVSGRLFQPRANEELRNILTGLTKLDAIEMGHSARNSFEKNYSIERFRAELSSFWNTEIHLTPRKKRPAEERAESLSIRSRVTGLLGEKSHD
jgi:glycosyltransferase involved in cell wall biosynthesis